MGESTGVWCAVSDSGICGAASLVSEVGVWLQTHESAVQGRHGNGGQRTSGLQIMWVSKPGTIPELRLLFGLILQKELLGSGTFSCKLGA